ncbi:MAG: hypothetical protein AAGF31_12160 [Planctomycetota bacterium]
MSTDHPENSRSQTLLGVAIALPIIAFLMFCGYVGWGLATGLVPDTKVLPGDELPSGLVKVVTKSAGLVPGERIIFFYSAAMTPEGDGNLLTDQRVISYVDDGNNKWADWIAIEDIVEMRFDKSDSWLEDSTIVVTSADGTELTLLASNEGGGDEQFVNAIRAASKSGAP